jgi:hypothetical protein
MHGKVVTFFLTEFQLINAKEMRENTNPPKKTTIKIATGKIHK